MVSWMENWREGIVGGSEWVLGAEVGVKELEEEVAGVCDVEV